jgi:putative thioredoxin
MVRWASAEGVAMLFDFYADWCQPCKQLTPKLEKLATESNGKFVLVKVDVDAHSGISDQLRIQSLPTVHAMVDGKFIDTFSGVLPDDELAAFVDRAVNVAAVGASQTQRSDGDDSESGETRPGGGGGGMDAETVVDAAFKALGSGDVETAAAAFGAALATDPPPAPGVRARAYAGAARCALRASPPDVDAAKQLVDAARKTVDGKFMEPVEIAAASAAAELHGAAADLGLDMSASGDALDDTLASLRADIDAMTKAGDKEGADDKREELSLRVLLQRGDAAGAVEVALESVKKGTRERGRAMCVRMFDALGATHPVTLSGRKRLSNLWFL